MHDEYTVLMSLVLDREAVPAEVQQLQEHLRTCRMCAETWQHWRVMDRRLALSPLLPAPVGLADKTIARLTQAELHRRRARWVAAGLLAALVALVAAVAPWGGLAFAWFHANITMFASWISIVTRWADALVLLGRGAWAAAISLGAPALAAAAGVLALATCVLGMTWLWLIPRRGDFWPATVR